MIEKEDKFIVIKRSDLRRLHPSSRAMFCEIIDEINQHRAMVQGKFDKPKYYVVNQDEPYADKVWEVIEQGEAEKARKSNV